MDVLDNGDVVLPQGDGFREIAEKAGETVREVAQEVDYSAQIDSLMQLVSYLDMMVLVLTCVVVLFMGLFGGYVLTNWMRSRN